MCMILNVHILKLVFMPFIPNNKLSKGIKKI